MKNDVNYRKLQLIGYYRGVLLFGGSYIFKAMGLVGNSFLLLFFNSNERNEANNRKEREALFFIEKKSEAL